MGTKSSEKKIDMSFPKEDEMPVAKKPDTRPTRKIPQRRGRKRERDDVYFTKGC